MELNPGVKELSNHTRIFFYVRTEIATLRGHSVGIISVSFSPRMREIIVVGDAQDMMISVWAWPSKIMKTLNKFAGRQRTSLSSPLSSSPESSSSKSSVASL